MTINGISGMPAMAGANMPAIDDVAFAVMVLRLQTLDSQIQVSITGQQARIDLGNAIRARKSQLEQELAASGATDPNDRVTVSDRSMYDYSVNADGEVETTSGDRLQHVDSNGDGEYSMEDRVDSDGDGTADSWDTRKRLVDAEIERLDEALDSVNGNSEIAMMELNRLVNQRQTALQMTTNVLSSMHQSQMGIINNIGK